MKRLVAILAATAFLATLCAAPASASFGLKETDVFFLGEDGIETIQAGVHPFAFATKVAFKTREDSTLGFEIPDEDPKDLTAFEIPGLIAKPSAAAACSTLDFLAPTVGCQAGSQVGTIEAEYHKPGEASTEPVYRLTTPPGVLMRLGFHIEGVALTIDVKLSEVPPYEGIGELTDIPQVVGVYRSKLTLWGVPADPAHDSQRDGVGCNGNGCGAGIAEQAFLTLPRSCRGPQPTSFEVTSWEGGFDAPPPVYTHDDATPANPLGFQGCGKLAFKPSIAAQPTSKAASSPSGLDFSLDVKDEGLENPTGLAGSDIERAEVTLPEGISINPSQAEGLAVCSEQQLEGETSHSQPGQGCPEASKIGTIEVETPLLPEKLLKGSLYVAKPYENPFDSLIAFYIVIKDPELGISVIQPAEVTSNPVTGQLVTTTEDMPQLPFSHFRLHFKEGARSPLISPPACGTYDGQNGDPEPVRAVLIPWSGGAPVHTSSTFQILSGPNDSPCPHGAAPFHPGFEAGTNNNAAGAYSPFYMRLTRQDGEQDMTKFSSALPPGVLGKIAGVPYCPEAGIAQAKSRTGAHGGIAEREHPSCPAASQIGRTLAGAGVGSELTYVPGKLYLAGPYQGDPLSVVSITPAVAGPFDAGVVVVRIALTLNPVTTVVEADGAHSDPIPHILQGIPLNVRDLRVYVDRPSFTLNATNCTPSSARATLWGGGTTFLPTFETPVGLAARYQAADCAALGFKPKLAIKLKGGTKRGKFPALKAIVTPRPGDANFAGAVVTLPHSAFLEQGHFGTICTKVQFAAGAGNGVACPPASIYGQATAWSPLLAEPLTGPVFLRSSNHNLPDMVVALHGLVDIDLASRIDSKEGGIRSTFEGIPDAPVSKFILEMQGGKKGLIVNSTNLCKSVNRAKVTLTGQNGRVDKTEPAVRAQCPQAKKHKAKRKRREG